MYKYAALGSIYSGESVEYFQKCIKSLRAQTVSVDVYLVIDGPLSVDLDALIDENVSFFAKVIRIPVNKGLSHALNNGLTHIDDSYDYVIRFDSDDINFENRFAETIDFIEEFQPDLVSFSMVEEYSTGELKARIQQNRKLTLSDFKFRNPIYHPASAFSLRKIKEHSCYENLFGFEDWATWIKLVSKGGTAWTCEKSAIYFRVNENMISRRFGWAYFIKEMVFSKYRLGYFGVTTEFVFLTSRFVRNLLGQRLFQWVFERRRY